MKYLSPRIVFGGFLSGAIAMGLYLAPTPVFLQIGVSIGYVLATFYILFALIYNSWTPWRDI